MTEHEADEADLALLTFVDICLALGISVAEAMRVAVERIPPLYLVASDPDTVH